MSGPADRLLGTPSGGPQQPPDMIRMVTDTEFVPNDHCDALGGPHLPDEAEGFGAPGEQTGELGELLSSQPGRGAGRRLAI